jgi:glycosyltransferase involved in cell wall biosynthesis
LEDDEFLRQKDLLEQEIITMSDGILCFDQGSSPEIQKRLAVSGKKVPTLIKSEFNCEDYQWVRDPGEIKKKYDIFPLDPLVLFVGELNDEYGSDILVEAIPGLLNHTPSLRFLLVGDGDHLWSIKIKARYMWYEHAIRLVGHKEGKDLQELFQAADILVIPNRSGTSPFHVLAGWSSKKPVVATQAGGCNLITHEENGILVEDDSDSLRHGIERLLSDWNKGHEIAQRGWEEIQNNYNWEAMVRKVEDLYQ